MSTARQTDRHLPTAQPGTDRPGTDRPGTDRPTATYPTGCPTGQSPFAGWRDQTPTELLPAVPASPAFPRVSTLPEPTSSREALDRARGPRRSRTKVSPAVARHLRAALAGILIAVALLTGLQLYAAQGIADARQAALSERDAQATEQSAPTSQAPAGQAATLPRTEGGGQPSMSGQTAPMSERTSAAQSDVRSDIQADWVTEDAGAAYDRTDPSASPLDLPRCTTSPDTPLPCLATISPDSRRAVVLEEDASLTAVVRR